MNIKYYIDRGARKLKFDLFFKRESKKAGALIETTMPDLPHPIYMRKGTSDPEVFYQIFHFESYKIDFGFEPKVIFDLGANIGLATVSFKNSFPNAKVIAVEPESTNYELLVKNTAAYKDVHCVKSGVWNKTTNLKITEGWGHWGFTTEEVDYEDHSTVKAISIDELMTKYGVDKIDVLKVDIESSEKELFEKNFEKWLPKTKVLIIELHDGMKKGCTRSVFKALVNYEFTMNYKGENIIITML